MTVADLFVLYLASLALGYELRFTEATRHIGRALSGTGSRTGFQDAITPPASSYLAFAVYGLSVAVVAFGFFRYGFLKGLAAFVGFLLLVNLNCVLLLPKPESPHFHDIVLRSMIRRHANYLRDGDQLRAAAMADLLQRAGMPVGELVQGIKAPLPAETGGKERIVNKQDADRIFGLNRAEWNTQAGQMVHPQGWTVRLNPLETGTGVVAFDPKTGTGLAVQPFFRDAEGPPEMLVVGSYYPAGTFREFSDQLKQEMEAAARSDLGPGYSVRISFSRMASPAPGFDVVEVMITRAEQ